ncbi:hypothetical protein TBR22_A35350 [Luteitalea sp. TBR-22]|uniref:tellurite resistance TerB family protein n=1 Tax=Luteitalea sp. TBR-22 TaxID=2802971 RepID=UPI001AFB20C0|nr:DUF533 domain-containing protein [Luteitalea sp. TBR-22]BCS34305.1 hypothetical protein TBR22_A35350 [Luteitalea sp. TBR-22]
MDPERLIGELVGGFLGGKTKRRRGGFDLSSLAGGVLGGGRRSSGGLVNAGTLLTVGGLIWGAIETMQQGSGSAPVQGGYAGGQAPPPVPGGGTPSAVPQGVMGAPGSVPVPPPLPPIPGATPPPVPVPDVPVPAQLLPLVQLAVSAARADGDLSEEERTTIRAHASRLGAAALVDAELAARRPLDAITPAFTTPEQKLAAYALAWAVVHGEGDVSPGERMYLTQLQRLLRLDHADVDRIEHETLAGGQQ